MECKKLTDKEYSDWMALSDSEYADSSFDCFLKCKIVALSLTTTII